MNLTQSQKIAIQARNKDILVSAGAGTGKTRVLVERFIDFLANSEAHVTEILALTFTEKAANEMKSRLRERLGELEMHQARRDLELAYISTVHSFASRVLREHPIEAGVDPDFRVLESEEAEDLKQQAIEEVLDELCVEGAPLFSLIRLYGKPRITEAALKILDVSKNAGKKLDDYFRDAEVEINLIPIDPTPHFESLGESQLAQDWKRFHSLDEWDWQMVADYQAWLATFSRKRGKKGESFWADAKECSKNFLSQKLVFFSKPWREKFEAFCLAIETAYEQKKAERGFLDFDDLEMKTVQLFANDSPVNQKLRERYQKKFRQIMVDEFQDTNFLQLKLVQLLTAGSNAFFVGDFKQSIYGFRGAEPSLFLEKEKECFEAEEAAAIPLVENFRSSSEVLSFANDFFEMIWAEDNLPFTPLIARAESEAGDQSNVEVLCVRSEKEESIEVARLREADAIADRILELNESGTSFGGIAILFQAMKDIGLYEQALKKRGIPYYAMSGRGFYHQPEIRDMMSFLSFLENPLSDIPLAATLRSPLFQITDNTLYWLADSVKSENRTTPLYASLRRYDTNSHIDMHQKRKLDGFLALTESILQIKDQLKISELLDFILKETAFELSVLADSQGIRRFANLKKLVSLAREFESYESVPLGAFIRTVRRLEAQEVRESEAQVEAEQSGRVVRLLSIHRSKGLEFPVVFVADLGRGRQSSDSKLILANAEKGYGMQVMNEMTYEWESPLDHATIDRVQDQKLREEWKRLFYVAVTRAKHQLILSGVFKEKTKPKDKFSEMSTWMDWVMSTLDQFPKVHFVDVKEMPPRKRKRAIAEKKDLENLFGNFGPRNPQEIIQDQTKFSEIENIFRPVLEAVDEHSIESSRVIDLPVSAYVLFSKSPATYKRVYEIGFRDSQVSEEREGVIHDESYDAADFGTRMHSILERINFRKSLERKDLMLYESFRELGVKAEKEASEILDRFLASDLFLVLKHAKVLKREIPFILNERHGLIHGVIDVLFQDGAGGWHVLDYKTATGDEESLKASHYEIQIAIYALAAKRLLGIEVTSGIIYYLKNGWSRTVPMTEKIINKYEDQVKVMQEQMLSVAVEERERF